MDWAPGDEAFCIKRGPWLAENDFGDILGEVSGPIFGDRLLVALVTRSSVFLGLHFAEWPETHLDGDNGWDAVRFIKINGHEADAFDREVISALNSEPVHARNNDAVHNSFHREDECGPFQDAGGGRD